MSRATRNESMKALHSMRREADRCIYDQRDVGGDAHGKPFKGGRCEPCWTAKLLSGKKRTRENAIERELERLRGAKDPLFVMKGKQRLARLRRELEEIMGKLSAVREQAREAA